MQNILHLVPCSFYLFVQLEMNIYDHIQYIPVPDITFQYQIPVITFQIPGVYNE